MRKEKIIILLILSVFIIGMVLAPASASKNVKVGKYKGTLTDKQYKTLKTAFKKNKKNTVVIIKCTNNKNCKISIQYLNGLCPQNYKYYKKGFYATVWDTRYGMDGLKVIDYKLNI